MNSEIITHAIESGREQKEMSKEAKDKYDDIRIKIITNELPNEQIEPREKTTPYLLLDTVQMLRYLTLARMFTYLSKKIFIPTVGIECFSLEILKLVKNPQPCDINLIQNIVSLEEFSSITTPRFRLPLSWVLISRFRIRSNALDRLTTLISVFSPEPPSLLSLSSGVVVRLPMKFFLVVLDENFAREFISK